MISAVGVSPLGHSIPLRSENLVSISLSALAMLERVEGRRGTPQPVDGVHLLLALPLFS